MMMTCEEYYNFMDDEFENGLVEWMEEHWDELMDYEGQGAGK